MRASRKYIPEGEFTAGADPELLCVRNNSYVAVQNIGVVTGTKENPQALPLGGNVQRDNVAIEFCVKPAKSCIDFVTHMGQTIGDMIDILPKDVTLEATASARFPVKELRHKECKQFFCTPDWNAWSMKLNEPPADAEKNNLRSCGGHFHTGFVYGSGNDFLRDFEGKGMFIRVCDALVALPATVLDNNPKAIRRRELYGKAGCFRPTEYGAEYRTLSNFWIKSPLLVELVYNLIKDSLSAMRDFVGGDLIEMIGPERIQRVVTTGKADEAEELVNNFVKRFLSEDSIKLYDDCLVKINEFDFMNEWKEITCI